MLINLYRLLAFLQLDSFLLNSPLDLLMEDLALICTMRVGIVPLAVLLILQFINRWNITLDLLMEDLALICTMRDGIVPLVVLLILQFINRWNITTRGKLNLLLP
jgi:hypothetical protein